MAASSLHAGEREPHLLRGLSLMDTALLLVGGVIGSAIFLTPADVAAQVPHPGIMLLLWVAAGFTALLACFAFAELGAMFPDAGGQYVYLREAYGDFVGFVYGWIIFTAGNNGAIAALSVGFAHFIGHAFPALHPDVAVFTLHSSSGRALWELTPAGLLAVGCITVLTIVNLFGVRHGAILENIASWLKFTAMAVFIVLGLLFGRGSWSHFHAAANSSAWPSLSALGVAFIALFWTYDGWVYVSWAAGEVREPRKTLPRAFILGIIIVAAIYVSMNVVYIYAMPTAQLARQDTVASAVAVTLFSERAALWLSLLIAVSCFGACGSAILSGARVYYAMAKDGVFFRSMAHVHPRWHTPVISLVAQGVWSALLALSGRYDQLYTYSIFMMTVSYTLTVAGLFVLRHKRPDAQRPYLCFGYPWLPALYIAIVGTFLVTTVIARPMEAVAGLVLGALGIPGYIYWRRRNLAA